MCFDWVGYWGKRRHAGLQCPSATSVAEMHLIDRYGDQRLKANTGASMNNLDVFRPECSLEELGRPEHISDDFEAAGINPKEDARAVPAISALAARRTTGKRCGPSIPVWASGFSRSLAPTSRILTCPISRK
jgi:hypothetical protein